MKIDSFRKSQKQRSAHHNKPDLETCLWRTSSKNIGPLNFDYQNSIHTSISGISLLSNCAGGLIYKR